MGAAKLCIVIDAALPPGAQLAQAVHAARAFAAHHPDLEAAWYRDSNTLAVLQASAQELDDLLVQADLFDVPAAGFREPDLADRLTAIALAPREGERLCRGLRLALS